MPLDEHAPGQSDTHLEDQVDDGCDGGAGDHLGDNVLVVMFQNMCTSIGVRSGWKLNKIV